MSTNIKVLGDPKKFYICDPKKNVNCRGAFEPNWCGKECFCTTDPKYSSDPSHPLTQAEYYKEQGIRARLI